MIIHKFLKRKGKFRYSVQNTAHSHRATPYAGTQQYLIQILEYMKLSQWVIYLYLLWAQNKFNLL